MEASSCRLNLEGGGHLAFTEYGDASGVPVLFCHGWPSSRTMAELMHEAATDLHMRIISPDRPGIYQSSYQPGRKLADWPGVVRQLMDHLRISAFRIMGISGGAPYAYVTAAALPERVQAVAVVSGAPPIVEPEKHARLLPLYRRMLWLHRNIPSVLRIIFHVARPIATVAPAFRFRHLLLQLLPPLDAAALRDSAAFDACFESARRGWRGPAEGMISDAEIYATPWGFRLEDVSRPVRLWHGMQDRSFSFSTAEQVAARFPNCKLHLIENAGHYSLPIRHIRRILGDLREVQ